MQIQLALRSLDWQPAKVTNAYLKAERQVLTKAAARGRSIARRAMRKRNRAARPGEAPSVRRGELKRFLLFAYEPARHVALFGPKKLGGSGDTPEALEHGKTTGRMVGRGKNRRRQSVAYEKRPAMVPALQDISPGLPAMWKNAIK
jgi:hypothetical protein